MTAFKTSLAASFLLIAVIISNMIFIRSTEKTILDGIAQVEGSDDLSDDESRQKTLDAISRISSGACCSFGAIRTGLKNK